MASYRERLARFLRELLRELPAEKARDWLVWAFCAAVALFPFGRVFIVAGPLVCLPLLVLTWVKDWKGSTLARFPLWPLFLVYFLNIAFQLCHARWPEVSWAALSPNLFRGFVLLFVGMECARTESDLRRVAFAFFLGGLVVGLDGVWQYATGRDFIRGAELANGRLTASFGSYSVGDYVGITLLPACAALLPLVAGEREGRMKKAGLAFLLLCPALFLWVFAQARSGYGALVLGTYLVCLSGRERPDLRMILLPPVLLLLLVFFGPTRVTLEHALGDVRGLLWASVVRTIWESPWLGTGVSSFAPAADALGLPRYDLVHPHNAYLQFLVDGGVIGFAVMCSFLFGLVLWSWRRIRRGVLEEARRGGGFFWRRALLFWGGFFGYLVVLGAGHDYYRTWFLSTGMSLIGLSLGACVNGRDGMKSE